MNDGPPVMRNHLLRLMDIRRIFVVVYILFITAAGCASKRPTFPPPVIPACFGVNIHFQGAPPDLDLIEGAGFGCIRMDMSWKKIETVRGVYDFVSTGYDSLTEACRQRNIRILYIIDYGNPLYESQRSVRSDSGRAAFASFAEAAVKRYSGRGIIWEIWNEPNGAAFWQPEPSADEYCRLVEATVPRLRKADSTALIIAPAASGIPLHWLEECFSRNLLYWVDGVSVHPYRKQAPETVTADYAALRELIERYSPGGREIPIVSGEWGYSLINWDNAPLTSVEQAEYLARMFLVNLSEGISLSIWYDWKDDGLNPQNREHHFGTVGFDLAPKLAYPAAKALMHTLHGYTFERRLETGDGDDYVLQLKKNQSTALALWTTDSLHEVTLPLSSGEGVLVAMTGDTTTIAWLDNQFMLTIGPAPQYLLIKDH